MKWEAWVLIVASVTSFLIILSDIGKPCEPITPRLAISIFFVQAACIWLVLRLAGVA